MNFLIENKEGKNLHLTHLEDLHIDHGKEGLDAAIASIRKVKTEISKKGSSSSLTKKVDGSPAVFVGHNPENGKYFVGSKSVFNKTPKINYSHKDIEQNHGHAPGLVHKLKAAFDHLHKVIPSKGVYQGDILHSNDDLEHHGSSVSFKPNTIKYTVHDKEADKVKHSKVGVAFHTAYHGDKLENMHASPLTSTKDFKHHKDVYQMNVVHESSGKKLSDFDQHRINKHIAKAKEYSKNVNHSEVTKHSPVLNTYINSTIRNNTKPSYSGFVNHVKEKSVKEPKLAKSLDDINSNKEHISNALKTHSHLQAAKNILINHMNKDAGAVDHEISGKKAHPEGYVLNHEGMTVKFVNRKEFSAANFANKG